jgi:amino acid adenylation domain-containing protein
VAALSPAQRALFELLRGRAGFAPPEASIPRRAPGQPCPLSLDQERLWFIHQLDSGSPAYNIYAADRFRGRIDLAALARALDEVVRRHEILRTTFAAREGLPVQEIAPPFHVLVPLVDLRGLPAAARAAAVDALANAHVRRPFQLTALPLFRLLLLREAEDSLVCATVFHHIVIDWVSYYLFQRELSSMYESFSAGLPPRLPAPLIQYGDYALWERQASRQQAVETQLDYWRRQLAGVPHELRLPADHPRPTLASGRGARRPLAFAAEHAAALRRLAQTERLTLFMMFLGLFQVLLFRLTGEETVLVGSPIAHRNLQLLQGLIGFLLNHLVFCTRLAGELSLRELLGRVRQVAIEAYAHQDVPFARLVEELRPERDLSRTPLTQVALLFLNPEQLGAVQMGGVEVSPYLVDGQSSKFDVTLALWDSADGFAGWVEYSTDLFDPPTIVRLVECFQALVGAALHSLDHALATLPLLSVAQRHQLVAEWSDTASAAPLDRCLGELFAAQADRAPDAPAVLCGATLLSYRELDLCANQLARRLRRLGVGPEQTVALCLELSLELVIAALAVLKAGGAYVPLEPAQPLDRLVFMAMDVRARVVLARGETASSLAARSLPVWSLDSAAASLAGECADRLPPAAGPGNLAYVIYTSGSAGTPKGVEVSHGALANLICWHLRAFAVGRGDRAAQVSTVAFDASVWELWPILVAGGQIDLVDEPLRTQPAELRDWLIERQISVAFLPTPLAEAVLPLAWPRSAALRLLLTGGDTLHLYAPAELPCALINDYGPTESTVVATSGRVPPERRAGRLPGIGRPIDGVEVWLADRAGELVPIGVTGQLCIGGAGLARGYRGQPRRTAESFVPHPWSARPGARLYRSGDLARHRGDGEIEFLGRADDQLKIRGFRIEPGEVEAALRGYSGLRDVAVLTRAAKGGAWERRLVAYVVPATDRQRPSAAALREHLAARLPEYMVPSQFLLLEALPRTAAGKLDRQALPDADGAGPSWQERVFAAPRTPVEQILAGIWSDVLGVESIGALDDFFGLGGHSLLAAQVLSRLREAFAVELPLKRLFEAVTVRELARSVEAAMAAQWEPTPPAIHRRSLAGMAPPLSLAQEPLWHLDQLLPGTGLFNVPFAVRLAGALEPAAIRQALAAVVARHQALRTTFPEEDGRPVQAIHATGTVPLAVIDLRRLAGPRSESEAVRLAGDFGQLPFDLAAGPLLRAALLRLGEQDQGLLFTMHHIVSDGWSIGVLLRDWTALYESFSSLGRPASGAPASAGAALPEQPIQYADFALWQRQWVESEAAAAQLAYWREHLGDAARRRPLALPLDAPRPVGGTFTMAQLALTVPSELSASLAALGRRERITPFMSVLAAFAVVLQRWTGQAELRLGTLVANRARRETEDLIGLFVNTLVLRLDLGGQPSWRDLLRRVRVAVLGAFAHQDLPFELVRRALDGADGEAPPAPLCEVMVIFQNAPLAPLELPGLRVVPWPAADGTGEAAPTLTAFDLVLVVEEGAEGMSYLLRYKTRLFHAATIGRTLRDLESALAAMARQPEAPA